MSVFRMGLAIWSHKGWVGSFLPSGSKSSEYLTHYAQRMQIVEGNTTFYAIPPIETVRKWRDDTPETFQFCFKIPQVISHHGELKDNITATHDFLARMAPLGARVGPYFLQLPPHFSRRHMNQLDTWLSAWPSEYRISVEVRHADWYTQQGERELIDLLNRHQAGHCLMDVRPLDLGDLPGAEADLAHARDHKPQVPMRPWVTGNLALVRYISHPDTARNAALFDEWVGRITQWLVDGVDVYFFMHCPGERTSPVNARLLYHQLAQRTPLAPLPWDQVETTIQGTLF